MKNIKGFDEFKEDKKLKVLDIFDFDNIPMLELDKAYIEYEPLDDDIDFYSLDEDYILEIKDNKSNEIHNTQDVVTQAKNQLKIQDFQIRIKSPNGVDYIEAKKLLKEYPDYFTMKTALLIPAIKRDVDIITEFMDIKGYFRTKSATYKDKRGRLWMVLLFDPKKQESIREMVLKHYKYAYHTSPSYNAESIDTNGILAQKSSVPFETNTKRVYLYLGNTSNPEYVNMMTSISKKIKRENKEFAGDFVEYEILLKNLPSNAEFYIDIHGYGKDYIYTETNIPVNAIRDTEDKSY